jgi:hypothetical protein
VLLVSYDVPYPEPLHAARPITGSVGAALLLAPFATSASFTRLDVQTAPVGCGPTRMQDPGLEALRSGNPTGRALPLLGALAGSTPATVVMEYLCGATLTVATLPC